MFYEMCIFGRCRLAYCQSYRAFGREKWRKKKQQNNKTRERFFEKDTHWFSQYPVSLMSMKMFFSRSFTSTNFGLYDRLDSIHHWSLDHQNNRKGECQNRKKGRERTNKLTETMCAGRNEFCYLLNRPHEFTTSTSSCCT